MEPSLASLHALAVEHRFGRKQPLAAGSRSLVVIEELERALAQLHDGYISRRAHIESAAVIEGGEASRRVDGCAGNDLGERHAEHEELRHDVRQVNHPAALRFCVPVRRESIRPQALPGRLLDRIPVEMIGHAVAEVEEDAAAARGHHFGQQNSPVVEDSVHPRRVHMRDDIAALEQRENGAKRRVVLTDVDHDRQIEGCRGLLCPAQRLEVVGTRDVVRQARLYANDDVAIASDSGLRQSDIRRADVMQLAAGGDDAGAGDVDETSW
jgi:hypothetical protein